MMSLRSLLALIAVLAALFVAYLVFVKWPFLDRYCADPQHKDWWECSGRAALGSQP